MSESFRLPVENRLNSVPDANADAQRALKNFRYIVGAVNEDALKVWADIWQELQQGVTPGGMVTPSAAEGFKPSCGWSEFLAGARRKANDGRER